MKKYSLIIGTGAILLAAISCSVEESKENIAESTRVRMEFSAGASTKTSLADDNRVLWSENDAISIFDNAGNCRFGIASGEDSPTGVFTGEALMQDTYHALYPYSSDASCTAGIISAVLPPEQTYAEGTFATMLNPSAAKTEAGSKILDFKNIASVLQVNVGNLTGKNVEEISVSADDAIAGAYTVDMNGTEYSATAADGAVNEVRLAAGGKNAGTYYLVLLPGKHSGMVVTVRYSDGTYTRMTARTEIDMPVSGGRTLSVDASRIEGPSWKLKSLSVHGSGLMGESSTLENARFQYPMNFCCDEAGNIYIAERCSHTIKKISVADNSVGIFAGKFIDNDPWGENAHYSDGSVLDAEFNSPVDIVYAGNNTFYVADWANNAIRKIYDGHVTTIGQRRIEGAADEWENVQMYENTDFKMSLDQFKFSRPQGLLYDKENNDLYVSSQSHYIVRVDFDANEVELYAGTPFNAGNTDGGRQGEGKMNAPRGMAFDNDGNLYVANEYGYCISKVDKNHNLTVFAGNPGSAGSADGNAAEARFNEPNYMICFENSLLVTDFRSHAVREVSLEDGSVSTWAGKLGTNDSSDGSITDCLVSYPIGLGYSYDRSQIYMTQAEAHCGLRVFNYE